MRKSKSDFDNLCRFVNTIDIGSTYKTKNMISQTGSSYNSMGATVSRYQTILKRLDFIEHSKHGEWKVKMHVPDWFTSSYASFLLGNYRWDHIRHRYVDTIYGMTKAQVLEKLKPKDEIASKVKASPFMGVTGVSGITGVCGVSLPIVENKSTFTEAGVVDKYGQMIAELNRLAKVKEAEELEFITKESRFSNIELKLKLLEAEMSTCTQYTQYVAKHVDDLLFFLEKTAENLIKYISEIRKTK